MPYTVRLRPYISAEAVGPRPAEKRPTRLSNLSESEHTTPASLDGIESPACLGRTVSKMACRSGELLAHAGADCNAG